MHFLLLQAVPQPNPGVPAYPVALILFAIIPLFLILTGTVMGFLALRDIRAAHGSLGGAVLAIFAAGLLPAMFILLVCGAGLTLLGEQLTPAGRPRTNVWLTAGCSVGVWLSFIMMRALHRDATGWIPPDSKPAGRSGLATASIVLTIVGAALALVILVMPFEKRYFIWGSNNGMQFTDLIILLSGLICGVLSRSEAAGKTCAWICGSLFVVMLFLLA